MIELQKQSTSKFHGPPRRCGVCHCVDNISLLLTGSAPLWGKTNKYLSLETDYQVRTVKSYSLNHSHPFSLAYDLLPQGVYRIVWGSLCQQHLCRDIMLQTTTKGKSPISKVSMADTFTVSVQLVPLRRWGSVLCSRPPHTHKQKMCHILTHVSATCCCYLTQQSWAYFSQLGHEHHNLKSANTEINKEERWNPYIYSYYSWSYLSAEEIQFKAPMEKIRLL